MFRITRKPMNNVRVLLTLEGRIVSDWVQVLESECEQSLVGENQVYLDCSGVTYVDARGIDLLRRLLHRRVQVINCPAMILALLENDD